MKLTTLVTVAGALSSVATARTFYETITHVSTIFADVTYTATASPKFVTDGSNNDDDDTTPSTQKTQQKDTSVTVQMSDQKVSSSLATLRTFEESSATVSASEPSSLITGDIYEAIPNSPGLNETFAKIILDYHNKVRRIHKVPEMSWNRTLWEYAQKHADSYVCGSGLKHTGGPFGENLLAGGSDPTVAAPSWYSEEKDWKYGVNGTQYSHFSQMVWKDSTQLGCAYHYCDDYNKSYPGYYVICNYYVFGNMMGTQANQVLPPVQSLEYLALTSYN